MPSRASSASTVTTCSSPPAPTSTASRSSRTAAKAGSARAPSSTIWRRASAPWPSGSTARSTASSAPPMPTTSPPLKPCAPDGGERRHLPRQVCRLVLGPRRGLLRRIRARHLSRRQPPGREDRHAGRVGRGGELFLPALGLWRAPARPLRGEPGLHRPRFAPQRGDELRPLRPPGFIRQPHHLRLGASRCRATRPT